MTGTLQLEILRIDTGDGSYLGIISPARWLADVFAEGGKSEGRSRMERTSRGKCLPVLVTPELDTVVWAGKVQSAFRFGQGTTLY